MPKFLNEEAYYNIKTLISPPLSINGAIKIFIFRFLFFNKTQTNLFNNFIMAEIQEEKKEFRRSLGLLDGTMLVSGGMIGSGIFIVSADMGRLVGGSGWLILLWVLTGFITVIAAIS